MPAAAETPGTPPMLRDGSRVLSMASAPAARHTRERRGAVCRNVIEPGE